MTLYNYKPTYRFHKQGRCQVCKKHFTSKDVKRLYCDEHERIAKKEVDKNESK